MLSFCTFAALFESELKVISLPSLDKWNKQPLKPEDIFTVPLNGPSMELPSAVIPLGGTWTANTKSPVSFAVLCHLKQGSIDVAQEQKSPMLSPWAIEASPIEAVPNRVGPPPQWTAKETRNAVLRARRDIMANVLNTLHGEASARKGEAPLLQSDELGLVTPKGKGTVPPDGSPSTVLDEDFDVSIPSPDTAVLDMSEMWMRRIPSDSCLSSLAGLNFEGNDDSSVMSFKNNEKHFATPQNPTGEDFDDEYPSEPSARLLIVSVPEQKNADTTNPIKTQVHNLPRGFRLSIEAIAMKQCPTEILVAVKPASSFDIRVLRVPMARGLPTSVVEDLDIRVCPVPIKRTHFDGKVKALDWDTGFDGTFQLRVVTARNADIGLEPVGPDELFGHIINVETSTLAGMSVSRISGSLNELSDQGATNDNLVTEKLELIMNTLLRFESTVNQRLNRMEKRMKENSDRLTRLEEEFSSRVEI